MVSLTESVRVTAATLLSFVDRLLGTEIGVAITFEAQIKTTLRFALKKAREVAPGAIVGVATYVQTGNWREGIRVICKFYSKDKDGHWQETVTTKTITVESLPDHLRKKIEATSESIDLSEFLNLEFGK